MLMKMSWIDFLSSIYYEDSVNKENPAFIEFIAPYANTDIVYIASQNVKDHSLKKYLEDIIVEREE